MNYKKKKDLFIIVSCMGGLGNQIIQYIFGRYLQEKFKCKLLFDISHFSVKYNKKNYFQRHTSECKLTKFNIQKIEFVKKIFIFNYLYIYKLLKILKFLRITNLVKNFFFKIKYNNIYFEDIDIDFEKKINSINFKPNSFYHGYWQQILNKKLFINKIKKEIKPKNFDQKRNKILQKINSRTVAIHIRGKENLLRKNKRHNFLNENYYLKTINFFLKKKNINFHIFTDDINYAKKIINKSKIKKFIFIKKFLNNSIQEFEILKNYKNYIIPNSSFSLVPALLSSKKNKIILSPNIWLKGKKNIFRETKKVEF